MKPFASILKAIPILGVTFVLWVALTTVAHVWLNTCPWHFARFTDSQLVPVIYGLPTGETLEKARAGKVVLGGCMVRPITGVCPYCHWPARVARRSRKPARNSTAEAKTSLRG